MKQVFLHEYNTYIPLHNSYTILYKTIQNIVKTNHFFIRKNHTIIQPYNYNILENNDIIHIDLSIQGGRLEDYPNFSSIISIFFHPVISLIILLPIYLLCNIIIKKKGYNKNVLFSFIFYASIFIAYLYVYFSKDMNILYILFVVPLFFPILFSILQLQKINFIITIGFTIVFLLCSIGLLLYIGFSNNIFPISYIIIGICQVILAKIFIYILQNYYKSCISIKYVIYIILINSLFSVPILLESFMKYIGN